MLSFLDNTGIFIHLIPLGALVCRGEGEGGGLAHLEKRQLLGHPTASPRTTREANKEMEPGPTQCDVAGKQEGVTLS